MNWFTITAQKPRATSRHAKDKFESVAAALCSQNHTLLLSLIPASLLDQRTGQTRQASAVNGVPSRRTMG
jgi:hypothetical protein